MNTVFTNGCFDILTLAHVRLLRFCHSIGDNVVIGINSDESVKKLKGESRPFNCERDRMEFLLSFSFVDEVKIFEETNVCRLLKETKCKTWVKGGDYDLNKLNPDEKKIADELGIKIVFFPYMNGYSTTKLFNKIND